MRLDLMGVAMVLFLITSSGCLTRPSQPKEASKHVAVENPNSSQPQLERSSQPRVERRAEPSARPKRQLAFLHVESTPPEAAIRINGTKQPLRTPADFTLLPGNYEISLTLDCYSSATTSLHLDGGENRTLIRQLESSPPSLTIRTTPPGAMIYVDGSPSNQRTPWTLAGIQPGDHLIKVELAGYRSQSKAVSASCGQTLAVNFDPFELEL